MFKKIPGNIQKDSGECSKRFRGMFKKILGNVEKDSGECWKWFRGMLKMIPGNVEKIRGNVIKDSGECYQRFWGMFQKIPGNAYNFKLIKVTFFLWTSFAISNEIIERSNTTIWYFHFSWNSNWKEIATTMRKRKERKIKSQNKQKEKMNQRNESNIRAFNLK